MIKLTNITIITASIISIMNLYLLNGLKNYSMTQWTYFIYVFFAITFFINIFFALKQFNHYYKNNEIKNLITGLYTFIPTLIILFGFFSINQNFSIVIALLLSTLTQTTITLCILINKYNESNKKTLITTIVIFITTLIILYLTQTSTTYNIVESFKLNYLIIWPLLVISYTFYFILIKKIDSNNKKTQIGKIITAGLLFLIFSILLFNTFAQENIFNHKSYIPIYFLIITILIILPFFIKSISDNKVKKFFVIMLIVALLIAITPSILNKIIEQKANTCKEDTDCVPFHYECTIPCGDPRYPYPLYNEKYIPLLKISKKINCLDIFYSLENLHASCVYFETIKKKPHCNTENRCEYKYDCENYCYKYENEPLQKYFRNPETFNYVIDECQCDVDICEIKCFLLQENYPDMEHLQKFDCQC